MTILALDFGKKYIGMAVGDTISGIAFPRDILQNSENIFEKILNFCQRENIQKIILGLPTFPEGKETEETKNARIFADTLEDYFFEKNISIPVDYHNEHLSSKTVLETMDHFGIQRKGNEKKRIDHISAAVFLQEYLDIQRRGKRGEKK
jgi:putative Holliday junction resolvase